MPVHTQPLINMGGGGHLEAGGDGCHVVCHGCHSRFCGEISFDECSHYGRFVRRNNKGPCLGFSKAAPTDPKLRKWEENPLRTVSVLDTKTQQRARWELHTVEPYEKVVFGAGSPDIPRTSWNPRVHKNLLLGTILGPKCMQSTSSHLRTRPLPSYFPTKFCPHGHGSIMKCLDS
jgi:hypothetical protein